jgi:ubiquinone/menaquinone biosynthesis C-methylase UbiE
MIKENLDNIYLFQALAEKLPLKDHCVDVVLFIASLHNIKGKENRIRALKEINRVLNRNGSALISVWSRHQYRFNKYLSGKNYKSVNKMENGDINLYWRQHGLNIPRYYHLYTKQEFYDDLIEAGFFDFEISEVSITSIEQPDNFFAKIYK